MEAQKLINSTTTTTATCSVVHGVAPAQVRLELRKSLFGRNTFDECLPFLLRGRIADSQFQATMHGLNQIINGSSVLRTGLWLSVLAMWVVLAVLIFAAFQGAFEYIYVCNGLLILFSLVTVFCAICYAVQLRRRVEQYIQDANQFYNPQGINFHLEKQYRSWSLVIDIMPQQSSAADYQQQQAAPMISGLQQQALVFPPPYTSGQPQQPPMVWASYSPAAYQKPSVDNV